MDVGRKNKGCTLVVDGNLNVNDELQIQKNSVVMLQVILLAASCL